MLLELCDMTLKDWLTQHADPTVESLEEILTFTQDVARGVQHLHSKHVCIKYYNFIAHVLGLLSVYLA